MFLQINRITMAVLGVATLTTLTTVLFQNPAQAKEESSYSVMIECRWPDGGVAQYPVKYPSLVRIAPPAPSIVTRDIAPPPSVDPLWSTAPVHLGGLSARFYQSGLDKVRRDWVQNSVCPEMYIKGITAAGPLTEHTRYSVDFPAVYDNLPNQVEIRFAEPAPLKPGSTFNLQFIENPRGVTVKGSVKIYVKAKLHGNVTGGGISPGVVTVSAYPWFKADIALSFKSQPAESSEAWGSDWLLESAQFANVDLEGLNIYADGLSPTLASAVTNSIRPQLTQMLNALIQNKAIETIQSSLKSRFNYSQAFDALPLNNPWIQSLKMRAGIALSLAFWSSSTPGGMTMVGDVSIAPIIDGLDCVVLTGQTGDACNKAYPVKPDFGRAFVTQDRPLLTFPGADFAVTLGRSVMNQALFSLWRAGNFQITQTIDASQTLLEFLRFPANGGAVKARLALGALQSPQIRFDPGSADPVIQLTRVKAAVTLLAKRDVNCPEPDSEEKSLCPLTTLIVQSDMSARAALEIQPTMLAGKPLPEGGMITFKLSDLKATNAVVSNPKDGTRFFPSGEKWIAVVAPIYDAKVGTIPIVSSIINLDKQSIANQFQTAPEFLKHLTQNLSFAILQKEISADALTVYGRFDLSPKGDQTPPQVSIFSVNGQQITAPDRTLRIAAGADALVELSVTDNVPEFVSYVTIQSSLDRGQSWQMHNGRRALRFAGLAAGQYLLSLKATDLAGNVSAVPARPADQSPLAPSEVLLIVVESSGPKTLLTEQPLPYSNQTVATVKFTASDERDVVDYDVALDEGTPQARTLPHYPLKIAQFGALSEGRHTIIVRARDTFGNLDQVGAQALFQVDTTAPHVAIDSLVNDHLAAHVLRVHLSGDDNGAPEQIRYSYSLTGPACEIDQSQQFQPGAVLTLTPCSAQPGDYTLAVYAQDGAGNVQTQPARAQFRIEAAGGPAGPTPPVIILNQPSDTQPPAPQPVNPVTPQVQAATPEAGGCQQSRAAPPLFEGALIAALLLRKRLLARLMSRA